MLLTSRYVLNSADFQNNLDFESSDAMLTEVLKSNVKDLLMLIPISSKIMLI